MPILFALTLGLAAALLFSAQPMIGKRVLPLLGGSPSVWNTCMLFFQGMLLAGYAYAHATSSRLGFRRQAVVHAGLLLLPLAVLPFGIGEEGARSLSTGSDPTWRLLGLLAARVGLPAFVVASTAPLLQRWFALTGHPDARDPYYLYGASNVGSLLALLAYPFAIEPSLSLARQAGLWSWGYGLLMVLTLCCAVVVGKGRRAETTVVEAGGPIPLRHRLGWVALAFVPSSLLLGVTTFLSTDIAPIPLLWVIPLALYLLTFILAFSTRGDAVRPVMVRILPLAAMLLAVVLGLGLLQPFWAPLHLLTFFAAAMVCHGELAKRRPLPTGLTAFYLAIALGGALGGVFNAIVAPTLFNRNAEYPLVLVLACVALPSSATGRGGPLRREARARPQPGSGHSERISRGLHAIVLPAIVLGCLVAQARGEGSWADSPMGIASVGLACGLVAFACWTHRSRPFRFALTLGAVLLASGLSAGTNGRVLLQARNFFGVLQVTEDPRSRSHRLFHGRTLHGQQSLEPARRLEPLAYFHRTGPIGQVFEVLSGRPGPKSIAVVGLGAGTIACYAEPGDHWTFYEIDPAVERIARDPRDFTFLRDCRARTLRVVVGDGRLRLVEAAGHAFDLIILDAFSADAIPVHLLTREAVRLYLDKLARGGILAFHISNRYLDLDALLGLQARDAGLACRVRYDLKLSPAEAKAGKQRSIWAVLAPADDDLRGIATDPRWHLPGRTRGEVWTDDFSDLARHLVLRPR